VKIKSIVIKVTIEQFFILLKNENSIVISEANSEHHCIFLVRVTKMYSDGHSVQISITILPCFLQCNIRVNVKQPFIYICIIMYTE